MTRRKHAAPQAKPVETEAPAKTGSTSHLFAARKPAQRKEITHEQVQADIAAFCASGGKIEVLGTTPALKHIGPAPADPGDKNPPQQPARKRRS